MLFAVSTVKDTLPNLQRFVAGNLAGGADHLLVFVDAPEATDPGVMEFLDASPGVTAISAGEDWWQGRRPRRLNVRQRINANLAKAALSRFDWAEWIFHIDADEVVQIDRVALSGAPRAARVACLAPLEVVSQPEWDGPPTLFKRLLDKDDLVLLQVLGVIERPTNGAYYHGHVHGKTGVRPELDLWLTLHRVFDENRELQRPWRHPGLRLLHYESFSGEEFVRKWTALLGAGPSVNFRSDREPTGVALRTLVGKDLSQEKAREYFLRLYERTTRDDLATLRDLGLLVEIDPRDGTHVPAPFPPGAADDLARLLEGLVTAPKQAFHPGQPVDGVRRLLDSIESPVKGGRRLWRRS